MRRFQVICGLGESSTILRLLAEAQPFHSGSSGGLSDEQRLASFSSQMAGQVPAEMRPSEGRAGLMSGEVSGSSLEMVLTHEMERFNRLIRLVGSTLADVGMALEGKLAMTPALETACNSMLINQVVISIPSQSHSPTSHFAVRSLVTIESQSSSMT